MSLEMSSAKSTALANKPLIAWDNYIETGSRTLLTANGTATSDGDPENATKGTTYDYWSAVPNSTTIIYKVVFPQNRSVSFCGVAAHNLGDLTADVKFQYSTDSGSTWKGTGAGVNSATDNQAIGFYHDRISADYWRLYISQVTSSDTISVGVIFIGDAIEVDRKIWRGYVPSVTPTKVDLQSNVSEGGNLLGSSVVNKGSMARADLAYLDPATLRGTDWTGFQRHFNSGKGFFWAWRPTDYGDLNWAWRTGAALAPQVTGPKDYHGATFDMRLYDDGT